MPRVPGEEGKKKEPPAYMGDPNATPIYRVVPAGVPGAREAEAYEPQHKVL